MKRALFALIVTTLAARAQERTFTGVITDSMCGADHKMMHITPDPKCVRDCVHASGTVKYALHDGQQSYKLSDQATPAAYAGQKVRVRGTLYPKTGIIAVKTIEPVR